MKPYYKDNQVEIYNADCRELIAGLRYDLIITDPPYGISLPTDYKDRGRGRLAQCNNYSRVHDDDKPFDPRLFLSGPCCFWGANYFADKLPTSSGWLVWDKLRPDGLDQADAELAWTNFTKGVRVFRHLWNGMMRASEHGESYHPTQKPVALMSWVLSLPWTPRGTILDPFMGSGPVLVAAKNDGRFAVGVEINEAYCEIAARRLMQESIFGEGALKASPAKSPNNRQGDNALNLFDKADVESGTAPVRQRD